MPGQGRSTQTILGCATPRRALDEDVEEYFRREVEPHVPDAWLNTTIRDSRDGEVGRVGYEINFNRYFYKFTPPRPLEEIEADIKVVQEKIMELLQEVAK